MRSAFAAAVIPHKAITVNPVASAAYFKTMSAPFVESHHHAAVT
jgi:hypothetical protein